MMFPLEGFLSLWIQILDFYLDNRTIMPGSTDTGQILWGGTPWDLAQAIGAFATVGALLAVTYQARLMNKQTELFASEYEYRLRPWLYPTDKGKLYIKEWKEESKKGLDVILYLYFKNEGGLPAKSFIAYVTFRTIVKGSKVQPSIYHGHAVFSQREFLVEGNTFFNDLEIEDNTKFSLPIMITVRLEYEYGAQSGVRKGFYEGQFQVKEMQYEDTRDYMIYTPFIMDRKDDFG